MPVALPALQNLVARIKKRSPASRMTEARELIAHVYAQRESDDEAVLVVKVPDWSQPPTVVLYPDDLEWACDCGGADPCVHILAASLALEASRLTDAPLPALTAARATLRYELATDRDGLRLRRRIVQPDGSTAPVAGALSGTDALLSPTDADLALDRALDALARRPIAVDQIPAFFALLAECPDVRLGVDSVTVSTDPVFPTATVTDHPRGFSLRLDRAAGITSVPCAGVARVGDVLRPLGATDLSGLRLERLPRARPVDLADAAELVLSTLPALDPRIAVDVQTRKLPKVNRGISPRVDMNLSLIEHKLSALPSIVYGEPVCARVEDHRLVYVQGDVPARRPDDEVAIAHQLRDQLGLRIGARTDFKGTDAVKFIQKLKEWSTDANAPRSFFGATPLVPRMEVTDEGFTLRFELPVAEGERAPEAGVKQADAATVLSAWRDGLDVVPLMGGGFAPLPLEWLTQHGARVANLLAAKGDSDALPKAALPALAKFCEALEHPVPPALHRLGALIDGFTALPTATLPADLRATLRPYQQRGIDWLCFLREAGMGAVLADDMGLGKTLQTLATFAGRALVVCPRSVLHNWADEIQRFRPGMRVATYHGPTRVLDPKSEVTLTTYAILRMDADELAAVPWSMVVLDEAQAIKNPDSQAARAAYKLTSGFHVALSGTPVENRLDELWSLMHFTNPGLLGGRADFDERYAKPLADGDRQALSRLREVIGPVLLRRMKREVAPELPPKIEAVLRCDLDEGERAVYDAVRAASQRDVVDALREGGSTLVALEALLRLRQAACHSALVPGQSAEGSSKVACLLDALESAAADGHKSLVFSQWTGLLDLIEPHLRAANIAFVRLDGSTRDRAAVVETFQSEAGVPVMLVSLKAGGTGLNLTAADHVFLLDPWWNPAVEDQAADRAHRIGQHRSVTVYKLVARDTVEEKILVLQTKKRSLAEAALSGADMATSLTRDDLLALLSD